MRLHALPVAMALALASHTTAFAESIDARLSRLEAQNRAQDAALKRQEATITEQKNLMQGAPNRVQKLETDLEQKQADGKRGEWYRNIEIAGLIEVEANYSSPYEGSSESDVTLATFELGIESQVSDWVRAGASLLYEQDETDLEVDTAWITLANLERTPFFLTAGQIYVPFGAYETNLVSDPLTLEIGETRETALQIGFEHSGFLGSAYVFNGDSKIKGKDRIGSWGANLGFGQESEGRAWSIGAGYLNDLGDSDNLNAFINDNRVAARTELLELREEGDDPVDFSIDPTDRTGGWTLNAAATFGPFNLIGEYLSATDHFNADSLSFRERGAKPSAWNIEAGYSFEVFGKETVAAVAYQGTREALALELPQERWSLGWSVGIFNNTSVALEWAHDIDYNQRDGGTGKSANTVTAQLAVEF